MSSLTGGDDLMAFLTELPSDLENGILSEAMLAAADVFADEARVQVRNDLVRTTIVTSVRNDKGIIVATVATRGKGAFLAPWEEFGTNPHVIKLRRAGTGKAAKRAFKAGDRYFGGTIDHPGARAHPFLRPALDTKQTEAVAAMASTDRIEDHCAMNGVEIAGIILTADAGVLALVSADRIRADELPQGIALPAILVTLGSSVDHETVAHEPRRRTTDRVQVTVKAANPRQKRDVLRAVRAACADQFGDYAGMTAVTVHLDGAGPAFGPGEEQIFEQSQDLMIGFTEAV